MARRGLRDRCDCWMAIAQYYDFYSYARSKYAGYSAIFFINRICQAFFKFFFKPLS
jgi:hypothetical protein